MSLFFFFSYLKEKSVSQGVAETEHKVLLGMLWNSLNNAALHPDRVLWSAVVVDSRTAVRLIEEQSATLGGKKKNGEKKNTFLLDSSGTARSRSVRGNEKCSGLGSLLAGDFSLSNSALQWPTSRIALQLG